MHDCGCSIDVSRASARSPLTPPQRRGTRMLTPEPSVSYAAN